MRKLKPVAAFCLLVILSLSGTAAQPQKGDHIDVTLVDGRVFKNAEVIRSDEESVLIRNGNALTAFKPHEIRASNQTGTTPPAEAPAAMPQKPQEDAPTPVPPPQPPATPSTTQPIEHALTALPRAEPARTNIVPTVILGVGLLAAIGYAFWQRRVRQKLEVEAKQLDTFANEIKAKLAGLEVRYSGIIDLDKTIDDRKGEIAATAGEIRQRKIEYDQVLAQLLTLKKELSLFDSEQTIVACGHYRPSYDFNTSEQYKQAIDGVREQQRNMLKSERAAHCSQKWLVNGSEIEGKKATKRTIRLMLRAFNGESDAIIANVTWSNVDRMMERLNAAYNAINKLGESYQCALSYDYMKLKEQELKLAIEYANKLKKEKDEQRELKERMRDEERARREMEDALKQTALDEERAKKALEQARIELRAASGAKEAALTDKISLLESRLQEALKNKERAISRAQQTRSGHVYIISNIGSFGETVFKIGMTRRLEPYDRVQELGDASVPFAFDVHAMIYTEDAPTLESQLHQRFDRHRVNLVNERKEFFNATMDELEAAVKELGEAIVLTKLAEAREYRETLERKKAMNVG